ncbi:2-succinylbenzoate--CoA ligase [Rivularia sp. UHCC 0363]|uniref:2-succinylbenzoate--CoA ligase n=1 Tax=Rivularia sp. UHCC 0363 TaxID=3110244 RepID=UPI002B21440F|nr:2-succinylbenzoate--CoA ligase [Rivularia sp. UHCC 0363]MEA5595857.1 2-succinylbenzoate--CoA ligase [Rivularia sp. UHCC 0363]
MENKFSYFVNNLIKNDALICEDSHLFGQLIKKFDLDIIRFKETYSALPKIILNERQPVRFLASFIAACRENCPVFLCNPDWGKQEWQQVFDLVEPDIIWGTENWYNPNPQSTKPHFQSPHIMIATGGSGGKIKFAVHTWDTLTASVRGFQEYFQIDKVNSFCLLPLYHVSGLMQFMRCFLTGGKLAILPFKMLESRDKFDINNVFKNNLDFFISLVPTQLERLLQKSDLTQWLSQFETVLLGGAPAWDELLQKAKFHHIRLAPTYGMTETASQIATLKPEDFLKGKVGCGKILPHAKVQIVGEGEFLKTNKIGSIHIQAESLTLGYYPLNGEIQTCLQIDDLAFLDEQGYLNIVGRNSDKIITGGENVYPAEVEAAIRATGMVADVCVIGLADRHWGQVVTAVCVANNSQILNENIKVLLQKKLSKYKIPKIWIAVDSLPRNSQGKINRQKLYDIAMEYTSLPIT